MINKVERRVRKKSKGKIRIIKTFRTAEEFREHFFPKDVEGERAARAKETGKDASRGAFAKAAQSLHA